VPTYHHQGVDRLGRGLVVTAHAEDGTVEAVEDPSLPFCVAVQWHPEVGEDPSLFEGIVAAARRRLHAGAART
jgi:putative glutamine amidotransferase